ncbi:MAG: hypothetical protein R3E48_05855 [Burkholderiaceae bacterium]
MLFLLCSLYVFPGLVGRDPWRVADASGFGVAWTMFRGSPGDWLMPNIVGVPVADGPLPSALAALVARALAPVLAPHHSIHLAAALVLGALLLSFWYAVYLLARRPGMQPQDPIGAAATRIDFARAIADSGLLILLACLGLITRMHETTASAAQVTLVGVLLFGLAHSLERPTRGAIIVGLTIAASVATKGLPIALAMAAIVVTIPFASRPFRLVAPTLVGIALPIGVAGAAIWPLLMLGHGTPGQQHLHYWLASNAAMVGLPRPEVLIYLARTAPWYFWPAWPLAAWAVHRWRGKLDEPAVALGMVALGWLAVPSILASTAAEEWLVPLTPPLALLAAIGLPTLRRGIVSLIDWFAVMTFTTLGIAIWIYLIAFETGWPPRMAYRLSVFMPENAPGPQALAIALGAAATLAWLLLVRWRISRRPPVIWRAVALSAGGLVLLWFLLMSLWLDAFNARNTYRSVGAGIGANLPADHDCVDTRRLGLAERATVSYYSGARLVPGDPASSPGHPAPDCHWLLIQDDGPLSFTTLETPDGWIEVWQGRRSPRIDERFRLYRRAPGKTAPDR